MMDLKPFLLAAVAPTLLLVLERLPLATLH